MVLKKMFFVAFCIMTFQLSAQDIYEIVSDNSFKVSSIRYDKNDVSIKKQLIHCSGAENYAGGTNQLVRVLCLCRVHVLLLCTGGISAGLTGGLVPQVGNALSAMVKRHRIDGVTAVRIYREFQRIPVRLLEVDIEKAVQIAAEENHYAYDAYYVACALDARLPLYSLDVGMIEIARKRGIVCW